MKKAVSGILGTAIFV
ncbi:MAG TPA: hypothetical protein DD434_05670 [Bacteroidales bacterium]|nr:hypothetical protein [Bacteroidales bacterium]